MVCMVNMCVCIESYDCSTSGEMTCPTIISDELVLSSLAGGEMFQFNLSLSARSGITCSTSRDCTIYDVVPYQPAVVSPCFIPHLHGHNIDSILKHSCIFLCLCLLNRPICKWYLGILDWVWESYDSPDAARIPLRLYWTLWNCCICSDRLHNSTR